MHAEVADADEADCAIHVISGYTREGVMLRSESPKHLWLIERRAR
jgi:hypothetical protein